MPNKENIKKWVVALRSGEHEQGRSALNYDNKFCCLGVACEVAIADGLTVKKSRNMDGKYAYDGGAATLPTAVREWLGFHDSNPVIEDNITAIVANDTLQLQFSEIADRLEKTYL